VLGTGESIDGLVRELIGVDSWALTENKDAVNVVKAIRSPGNILGKQKLVEKSISEKYVGLVCEQILLATMQMIHLKLLIGSQKESYKMMRQGDIAR